MKKIAASLTIIIISIGCQNVTDILPATDIKHIEKYHCWPYNVNVYSIEKVEIDSLFYTYPLKGFFVNNPKYKISTWAKYSKIDTCEWLGIKKTLKQCDGNNELYLKVLKGSDIYYAGSYQYFKNQQGKQKRSYEKILILDLSNKKLHIFKNVNKVF